MRALLARVAMAGVVAAAVAGCDWGMVRGDAAQTGNAFEAEMGLGNVADLEQKWVADTGDGAPTGLVTAAGAVVTLVDRDIMVAVDADDGSTRWTVDVEPPVEPDIGLRRDWSVPSAQGATVYLGYANPLTSGGAGGGVVAIDGRTGELSAGPHTWTAVTSSLTFSGDDTWSSYGLTAPMAEWSLTGIEGRLADGTIVRSAVDTSGAGYGTASPAVADGMVYASRFGGGVLEAFDAVGVEGCADPGVGFLVCEPLWSAPVSGTPRPAVSGSTVYAATDTGVSAFATGDDVRGPDQQPLWTADVAGATSVALTPSADATTLFVGSSDGVLRAFAADGCGAAACASVWTAAVGGTVRSPVIANGVVYVTSSDGHVGAYPAAGCGAATCAPLWSAVAPGAPTGLIVANGQVLVATSTGEIIAYGLP